MPRTTCTKTSAHKRQGGAPTESATCWTIGSNVKGTDGRTYVVVKSGNSRRWSPRQSPRKSFRKSPRKSLRKSPRNSPRKSPREPKSQPRAVRGPVSPAQLRKSLYALYAALAEGDAVILVYRDGNQKTIAPSLKTANARRNATSKAIDSAQEDPRVRAILSSARSYDVFERLQRKARGKSVQEVLDHWPKYWTSVVDRKMRAF